MRYVILMCSILLTTLLGCHTLPTGQVKQVGRDTYEEVQNMLGPFPGWKEWQKKQTRAEKVQQEISAPAKWILWISLPTALVLAAITIANAGGLQKTTGPLAVVAGLTSAGAALWMLLSAYAILILLGTLIIGVAMWKAKDRGLQWV